MLSFPLKPEIWLLQFGNQATLLTFESLQHVNIRDEIHICSHHYIVPAVVARPADDGGRERGGAWVGRELLPPGAVEDEPGEVDHEERRLEVRREERLVVLWCIDKKTC